MTTPAAGRHLLTPPGAAARFEVTIGENDIAVAAIGAAPRAWLLRDRSQDAYLDLFQGLADGLGTRSPLSRQAPAARADDPSLSAVLVAPAAPDILYGYGDPCVVRVGPNDYRLLVTSNDAPDAFPILRSHDLKRWRPSGFVFPKGHAPKWTLTGEGVSDFWAPEMHQVEGEWWVCFTARERNGALAIGLARAASPDGPFTADEEPIVRGGVIDSHILVDAAGDPWLVWKKDDNDLWPARLNALLHDQPHLVGPLFRQEQDRRTAALSLTLHPWIRTLPPMEQFFAQQPLIEAVAEDLSGFITRLTTMRDTAPSAIDEILAALRTRIFIQRLSPGGRRLLGDPQVILQNDLPWEGHLIEGVWITCEGGRYHLLYAGNDFSTARYGIGLAVADAPQGPYRKHDEALLSSGQHWWGPGHPSVVTRDDGKQQIFLHAFRPGEAGYKRFRALLTAQITFDGDAPRLRPVD